MTLINKHKWGIFGQELSQRFSDLGEILHEATIKSHMTKGNFIPLIKEATTQ